MKMCMMFLLTLKFVFSFFIHFVKRSIYEIRKLVLSNLRCKEDLSLQNYSQLTSKTDNLYNENFCNIDHYILQNKDSELSLNLGFTKIHGNVKLKCQVNGLKSIKEIRHNYYFQKSNICTMAELDASELNIRYDGLVNFLSITQTVLIKAALKNVKILYILKIYPFQRITSYIDDVRIDELRIVTRLSGLSIISLIANLIIICTLKVMSFIILCFVEFLTRSYLNKTFSEFYLSQYNALEKVGKKTNFTSAQMKCFKDEIEIAGETSLEPKLDGPVSYYYNLMRGLFEFHEVFNKVIVSLAFNGNVKDFSHNSLDSVVSESDLISTQSSESGESSNHFSVSAESESGFDYSGLGHENRINSNESLENELDSESTESDYNNEPLSPVIESNSENEISYQDANGSDHEDNAQLEESFNEGESQSKNNFRDESSFNLEKLESHPESESNEKIQNWNYQPGMCVNENDYQSERICCEETSTQTTINFIGNFEPKSSCNNDDTHSEIVCNPESHCQPTNTFNAKDDAEPGNVDDDNNTSENNFKGEDVTQSEIICYEDNTHSTNNLNAEDNKPDCNIICENDTQFENIAAKIALKPVYFTGENVT